jgi:hypothetical protein
MRNYNLALDIGGKVRFDYATNASEALDGVVQDMMEEMENEF